jgi:hypothetical protein
VWAVDFINVLDIVDEYITQREVRLTFLWSRMRVIDEHSLNGRESPPTLRLHLPRLAPECPACVCKRQPGPPNCTTSCTLGTVACALMLPAGLRRCPGVRLTVWLSAPITSTHRLRDPPAAI